jgi:hypothetical protein
MIPVVKKEPPVMTEELKAAIRNRMAFSTPNGNGSGFWSAYKPRKFCCQVDGSLVAVYDCEAEHWFMVDEHTGNTAWFRTILRDALEGIEITMVPRKQLKNIHRLGFVGVVRSRLNVAKEK